ncbi:MAG TPA: dienelactone hydrolase family protein [Candidatus Eisenbacteria bacterium]|nr:dienelactone hydrolase family protein [Candidatus Eisenbacteria bacterium]
MKRILALILLLSAAALPAPANAGSMVHFTQDDQRVSGYLALPKTQGTHAALVVVHEWWGLTDWVKAQTDSLAKHGYVALAVDLYGGKVATTSELAHQYSSGLTESAAVEKLAAAASFLRGRDDVRGHAVGTIGWCMGGKLAIRLGAEDPAIRAVVMYYGAPITDEEQIEAIQGSVLGHFGAEDKGPTAEQAREFEAALKKAGKKSEFHVYQGAGHAFANPSNPFGGYRKEAARTAWKRTLTFLDRELKKASIPKKQASD